MGYEWGDLVEHLSAGWKATVVNPEPMSESEAKEKIRDGEIERSELDRGDVVPDEFPEDSVVVQSGNKMFVCPGDEMTILKKKCQRSTDVPLLSESFRIEGKIDESELVDV